MFEMSIVETSKMIDHYKLDDGRIWSVEKAMFVSEENVPEDAIIGPCWDKNGNSTVDGLVNGCLKFYGYNLGEFAEQA